MSSRNLILILATSGFASTFSGRAVEPMVGVIARDLSSAPQTIALLSAAFALPYAFIQPILGPIGDALGKESVMKVALALLFLALACSIFAPNAETLFTLRVIAGAAAGGSIPVSLALIGDRVEMAQRQVALSRYMVAVIIGQLAGSSLAGLMAEWVGWRGVFTCSTLMVALSLATIVLGFRNAPPGGQFDMRSALLRYRDILSNPRALTLFSLVFVEGIAVFGIFPYIAPLLEERGGGGAAEAGFAIGGFAVGGLVYSVLVTWMLRRMGIGKILLGGGFFAGAALVILGLGGDWKLDAAALVLMGLGFYMLHNTFQAQVTEVAPGARASAVALHAFSFFCGQALGVVLMGLGLRNIGLTGATSGAALVILGVGLTASIVLTRQAAQRAR
ncbi:putative MFS family arabinose efflux permease [Microvirga lupini]|uniref:Putative MFS family arabinose efflux permease n=1 Tax=Microvirga lupini TaxID=420324 RepID=A0A7W4VMR6_9HYPH|nr:MFS transporter [Microvirga lupini]MBB3019978.1 putative MFS family arabinose efflux permease [Microvirga lupini]